MNTAIVHLATAQCMFDNCMYLHAFGYIDVADEIVRLHPSETSTTSSLVAHRDDVAFIEHHDGKGLGKHVYDCRIDDLPREKRMKKAQKHSGRKGVVKP